MALTEKSDQQKEKTTDQMASMAKFKELRNSKNRPHPPVVWGGRSRRLAHHKQKTELRRHSKSKANTAECQS